MVAFNRIGMRNGDRALCEGGTQSGKSTLCAGSPIYRFEDTLCGEYLANYPDAQLLIVDTKPRYRAEFDVNGLSDKRHYKEWAHGTYIPGSTRIDPWDIQGMMRAFNIGRIVIVQTEAVDRDAAGVVACIEHFRRHVNRKHKRMVYVDEVMDFYTQSGTPLKGTGNIILRCARAGAERHFTTLLGAQRLKGIPPQLWELINKFYLFRMDLESDMGRAYEAGVPRDMTPPEEDYLFKFWTKTSRHKVYGPYHLRVRS
jgi:hypothetical protein